MLDDVLTRRQGSRRLSCASRTDQMWRLLHEGAPHAQCDSGLGPDIHLRWRSVVARHRLLGLATAASSLRPAEGKRSQIAPKEALLGVSAGYGVLQGGYGLEVSGRYLGGRPVHNIGMTAWEYMIIALPEFEAPTASRGLSDAVRALNNDGARGWEAVSMTVLGDGSVAVLCKRPLPDNR